MSSDKDRAWEEVQKKAFTHWVNSILEKRALEKITSLEVSFADGNTIIHFVELLCEKKIKKKWTQNPKERIRRIENTHLALDFLRENGVEPKYLTIASEDFIDGNLKLILGFLWMLFRKFRIAKAMGSDNIDSTTDALLTWCRDITKGYAGVNIENFKNSFNDGKAFLAMIHAFDNKLLNYNEQLEDHSTQENIETAFNLAEKNLGIPQLLDSKDLLDGTIDERSVVLYVSLYFHTFVSAQEKNKIEREKRAVTEKVSDLESEIEILNKKCNQKDEELTTLRGKLDEKEEAYRNLQREKDALAAENEDLRQNYKKLKEAVDARQKLELSGLDALRKNLLEHLRDMNIWKGYLEQDRDYESETIQLRAESEIADRSFEDQLEYLTESLGSENKKLDELLAQRKIEEAEKKAAAGVDEEHVDDAKGEDSGEKTAKKPKKKKPVEETADEGKHEKAEKPKKKAAAQ